MGFPTIITIGLVTSWASYTAAISHNIPLTRRTSSGFTSSSILNTAYGQSNLTTHLDGLEYLADITFGTTNFHVVVDTGSSDTWLVGVGFKCIYTSPIGSKSELSQEQCGFGPGFKSSSTFKRLPNETLRVSYGSGETLTGIVGTEKVTFGGISVDNQQVGIIDHGSWQGHGIASGLVGLAFPSLTNTISGNESEADTGSAVKLKYNPIFTSMYTEGLVDPVFSLAIDRGDSSGGILTLGGLPTTVISSQFISVPLEMMTLHDANSTELISMQNSMDSKPAYQFYAIHIDGFVYGHIRPAPLIVTSIQVIVDSGNTLNRIPANTSMAINEQFDPPARYNKFRGAYMVQCDATAPQFGVTIAGQTFYINKVDMIYKAGPNDCLSAITDAPNGMSILGDAFLKNVVAVFDVGASEMRFAAREY